jgi:NAD(P)-dependent dehydrogenase (short-subunit alcohol dehydrogenase family)
MIAKSLALNGASKVYIIGRRKDKLDLVSAQSPHGNIIPLVGDVTSRTSLLALSTQISSEVGYVNVVIANSGIMGPGIRSLPDEHSVADVRKLVMDTPMEDFTEVFNVNTTAAFYTAMAFLELLDAGNRAGNVSPKVSSQVIVTSSIGGFNRAHDAGFAYCASKAATTHLVKLLATYLTRFNVRCNALAPGCKCCFLPHVSFLHCKCYP